MKNLTALPALLLVATLIQAQNEAPSFSVRLSTDSVLMGNYFQVQFILENGNGTDFQAPEFDESFHVVSGPAYSNFTSIVNGELSQKMTISYYLEPRQEGLYYIGPASIRVGNEMLETEPVEVLVVPNPDGIKQQPHVEAPSFRFEFGDPFQSESPLFKDPFFDIPQRILPPGPDTPPDRYKKKRKTIRI